MEPSLEERISALETENARINEKLNGLLMVVTEQALSLSIAYDALEQMAVVSFPKVPAVSPSLN